MSWTQTSLPTLDHYAFDLRSGLRDAAKKSLQALEENINDLGYAWLDGYMEGIMARAQSNAPITILIKTPSRTHGTSKKTRATTAAGKERADKVKALNAKSPVSKTANPSLSARQPLSPLQPRLLNLAPPSPSPLGPSSSPGPTKGKADKGQAVPPKENSGKGKGKAKAKTNGKGKKAKGKKAADEDDPMEAEKIGTPVEVDEPMEEERPSKPSSKASKASKSSGKNATTKLPEILEPAAAPAPLAIEQPIEADEPMEAEAPGPVLGSEAEAAAHDEDIPRPISLAPTTQTQQTDLSMIVEGDEDTSSASSRSARPADKKSGSASQRSTQAVPVVENMALDVSSQADSASGVAKANGPARKSLEDMIVAEESHPESGASASVGAGASASPATESPAPQPAHPPVPVRQVRSSWLTKALGTDKVPITAATATTSTADRGTFRKSFAATSQKPPQVDFSSFRKSLVPAGTLKRKSEVGMDEDKDGDDDEETRPEKVVKVDVPATTPGAAPTAAPTAASTSASVPVRPTFDRQVSRERESIFPVRPTSAPHAVVVPVPATTPGPANANTVDAPEHASADRHRSDIHKVTKALDELRERAREKEAAAKAKAMTLAASAGPKRTSTAAPPNTGTGFLRGLGSLGVGLGRSLGLGGQGPKSAEDEALRLQRELEEERRASLEAKEELARLMGEMEKEKDKDKPVPTAVSATSSGKQNMEDDLQAEQDELDPDTDDEREVTEQIEVEIEQTEFVTAPQASLAAPTVSPPRRPRPAMQSTTPSGTPPRKVPAREAPALHARQEKHAHTSPAKEALPSTRAAEPTPAEVLVRHPSDEHVAQPSKGATAAAAAQRSAPAPSPGAPFRARDAEASTQDELADEEMKEVDERQETVRRPLQPQTSKARIPHSSSSTTLAPSQLLGASSSSQATTIGSLSQASTVAGKMLGVKPSVAPVKSVQLAAAAAKKDLAASEKRAVSRDQIEQRKRDLAERRAEQDRAREEEIKRARMVELDEKRRQRAEQEKKRKEAEERKLALAQAKKAKEDEEREREREAAAKAKAEEDAKKRKLAQAQMNKSTGPTTGNGMKRVGQPATAPSAGAAIPPTQGLKGKEPVRIAKPAAAGVPSKLGPTSFRTAPSTSAHEQPHQTHASTVMLVTPQQPRSLGPPSRPSQMTGQAGHHPQPQAVRASVTVQQQQQQYLATTLQTQQGSAVLQYSREALQQTLEERALEVQSEDIVLPDIASEYSDSDDEDRTPDFKRPQWAESPELRAALAEQAYRDPDELFGPIKPISMEELFKVRQGKFRARTSSANWAKGDGLTRAEEVEYARRMGFRPIGQSSQGSGA
ncbi:hypothetical protein JCM24511_08332 [Saitozyma sp. JCM 24511]|nr:hypothetical protein JCM24511_08332 [Saitozyma sp. JCM 24511]